VMADQPQGVIFENLRDDCQEPLLLLIFTSLWSVTVRKTIVTSGQHIYIGAFAFTSPSLLLKEMPLRRFSPFSHVFLDSWLLLSDYLVWNGPGPSMLAIDNRKSSR
jgi:hypothetical protein